VLAGVLVSTLHLDARRTQPKEASSAQMQGTIALHDQSRVSRPTTPAGTSVNSRPEVTNISAHTTQRLTLDQWGQIAVILTMLILALQTRALRMQISRSDLQSIYNRYLDLTKIEVKEPTLHKMFFYGRDFDRLSALTPEQLHDRALSLLIFDQFALLYNMSKQPLWSRLSRSALRRVPFFWRTKVCQRFLDRHRTVWEINADYVEGVITNPLLIQAWRDWGLGETWRGSQFFEFVNETIDSWQEEQRQQTPQNVPNDNESLGATEVAKLKGSQKVLDQHSN
jgi:hypothetical protein